MNERNPEQAKEDHPSRGDAPEGYELLFAGRGAELFIEVERDHGRGGIEDGAHRAHQRGQQRGDHQSHEAGRKKIYDRGGESDITVGDRAIHDGKELRIQRECDNPGNYEKEHWKNLQETGKNCAGFGMALVSRREDPLDDDLVGTPVRSKCQESEHRRKIPVHGKSGSEIGLTMPWK